MYAARLTHFERRLMLINIRCLANNWELQQLILRRRLMTIVKYNPLASYTDTGMLCGKHIRRRFALKRNGKLLVWMWL